MKIKTGDNVIVLSGKDRGKTGKVVQVLNNKTTMQSYVVVEGLHMLKKHLRSGRQGEKGQVIELPSPIHASSVALVDPKTNKGTRVGYRVEGDTKKRVTKGSNEIIG